MRKKCPKCKKGNSNDASFCQNCGEDLSKTSKLSNSGDKSWWNKQSTGGKAIIGLLGVCIIGLILIMAVVGMFASNPNTQTSVSNSTNNAPSTSTAATWHSIANYTGSGDKDTSSFQTKGNKFKVNMNATEDNQYGYINFFAYLEGQSSGIVGEGFIENFNQTTQGDEFEVTASPGSYYLKISTANLKNYNIEVFDYY